MSYNKILLIIYIVFLCLMSLVALVMYKSDKEKAKSGKIRTKEKSLLFVSSFGGALGAFFARKIYHHKTEKVYFSIVIYLSLICELALLGLFIYGGFVK